MTLSAESIRGSLAGIARPPLRRILELDQSGDDTFLGYSCVAGPSRIYGGQAVGQALIAAARTVPADRPVHSIHGHFLYPGDTSSPVEYQVDRPRDGGSFTSRLVRAVQGDRTIFTATASFQRVEDGLSHQVRDCEPAVAPEDLPDFADTLSADQLAGAQWLPHLFSGIAAEFRFPEEYPRLAVKRGETRPPKQRAWVRSPEPLGDDPVIHAGAFGYISDLFLLSSALPPHAITTEDANLQLASLDHTVWFHEPFRIDQWHLYEQEGSWMGHSRGLCRGHLYNREGTLVATTMQEGLLRIR